MTLHGKGFFIWKVRDCEGGNPGAIAAAAAQAGLTHVLIKIANGNYANNIDPQSKADLIAPVAQALRGQGIQVWGWHYVYGIDPAAEAAIAVRRTRELGLDGYVIDAEAEYKEPGKANAARRFMRDLRTGLQNTPVALSSFRFPSYHPQLPWREFLEGCDYNMPQVYWEKAHNAGGQLARTVREFQALTPARPVIPTGPTYKWEGWRPSEADIAEFLSAATQLNLPAVNFFSWDECRRDLKSMWDQITRYSYGSSSPPQPPEPAPEKGLPEQYIDALNRRDSQTAASLYLERAVQITTARTIQGPAAIQSWIAELLNEKLPEAVFTLTGTTASGNSHRFTWKASSKKGSVTNGRDTMGIFQGKIAYHYTSFTIS
jgi:hypothetical protein